MNFIIFERKRNRTLGTSATKPVETPLMKQYYQIKSKHADALLLFRVGDFYETFSDDAIKTSQILGITLTKRANGAASFVELAGFPYHALDTYLPKLVRAGQRVAICDQLEDPKQTKTIVKRGITELVTPGVSFNDEVIDRQENHFLACVHLERSMAGVAFLDISTGEFLTAEGTYEYVDKLISNFQPKEILFERNKEHLYKEFFGKRYYSYKLDDWIFTSEFAQEKLLKHFETTSLKGFGIQNLPCGIIAAGAVLQYLEQTCHDKIGHIISISRIEEDLYVWLDKFTIRNLELFSSPNENAKSLIEIIDKTVSPMGSRMLKRWMALPLKNIKAIKERHEVVDYFIKENSCFQDIRDHVKAVGDLERIISKVAAGRVNPREIVQLKLSLQQIAPIVETCSKSKNEMLKSIGEQLNPFFGVVEKIDHMIVDEPSVVINKGGVIADGVDPDLDEYRKVFHSGKDYIIQIQQREIEKTGISSLKIGYNNVFGYYIEVRNTHKDKVPEDWVRKQTLTQAERYITSELKEYETKVLEAEGKMLQIEIELFQKLVVELSRYVEGIQLNATLIGKLDCLLSFASMAMDSEYVRPEIVEGDVLDIKDGRHPVIEKLLPVDESYIANDVMLNKDDQQIMIITGPNMSGKSALLRQTALIVLLAQMGSFVPASSATIGLVDKIFTRVGASDNISQGESTFMVEMNEAASILNNVTPGSLVLLDEIGRGTSTYDGISIAWAIVEYLHEQPKATAKTMFATHYHELNEISKTLKRVKNFNVSVKELENKIVFMRKLKEGGSEHSFGIHVAQMAGMPRSVVNRANQVLSELEGGRDKKSLAKPVDSISKNREGVQLSFFQLDDPVLKQIRDEISALDINNLTPMEALNRLNEIKRLTGLK